MSEVIVKNVVVKNQFGLHARPAAQLAQEAQKFSAIISLELEGRTIDVKSILDILTLAAPQGTKLLLKAEGHDADPALKSISGLFDDLFGEKAG